MIEFFVAAVATFVAGFILMPMGLLFARLLGLYAIVPERRCFVYVLFGKVIATIDVPGLHLLIGKLGWRALIVNWLGTCHVLDMRLDQEYLRSQPVNSEEGAPMGIGIWYEMFISDPVSYLFKNTDPRGSLGANVSNSVRPGNAGGVLVVKLCQPQALGVRSQDVHGPGLGAGFRDVQEVGSRS